MAEQQDEDKTEEPTSRRLQQARERGELPRSPDFSGAIEVLAICILMFFLGSGMVESFSALLRGSLTFDHGQLEAVQELPQVFGERLLEGLWAVRWVFLLSIVVVLLSAALNGGISFSSQAIAPKLSKLNPLNGVKRIFGAQAWMGVLRNLLKFGVIAAVLASMLWLRKQEVLAIARDPLLPMLTSGTSLALMTFILVSMAVAGIAILDLPYQRWSYLRRLRMTKQEIRDEIKDIEGRPEVKRHVRRKQREMKRGRMLQKVRDADVVIVNPSEFAVALEYDDARHSVPVLLAKGQGDVAKAIKEQASKSGVPLISSPLLARAIYFTTDIDRGIPEGLYRAVAAVLAYVFRVSALSPYMQTPEVPKAELPAEFMFDEDGRPINGQQA